MRLGTTIARLAIGTTLLIAAACDDPLVIDNRQLRPGVLLQNGIPAAVDIPVAVDHGTPFQISVATFATGCDEVGDTVIDVQGSTIEITPQDWFVIPLPGMSCPDNVRHLVHSAQVTLQQAGAATIRIKGRREPGGDDIVLVTDLTVR